jgi:hypothetical protein
VNKFEDGKIPAQSGGRTFQPFAGFENLTGSFPGMWSIQSHHLLELEWPSVDLNGTISALAIKTGEFH